MQNPNWINNSDLELFTDSAGGENLGCGAYLHGSWVFMKWPSHWKSEILSDITYLEIIPISLTIYLWGSRFENKKVLMHCDNESVVSVLNVKSSKSERVMSILRHIVYWSLIHNCQFKAKHISSYDNIIADSLSRGQLDKFKKVAPTAEETPTEIPEEFFNLLI